MLMNKKHRFFAFLLLLCITLLVGCDAGLQPAQPNEGVYYNVTYILNMPNEPYREYTEKVLRGEYAPYCSQPGNEQYELAGWYCNGEEFDFYTTPITEDIRVEPNWILRQYTVQYRIVEQVRVETVVYYGDKTGDPYQDLPERFASIEEWAQLLEQGYVFVGWMLDGELWDFENDVVTEDIVLDAYFVLADAMQ